MAQSDAVSVQVLYASRYQRFINDNVLAHCKPGQLWVGISRSSLFDAAGAGARAGRWPHRGRMLDGAEAGFASRGTPLHELDNLYLTPRLGSHTRESRAARELVRGAAPPRDADRATRIRLRRDPQRADGAGQAPSSRPGWPAGRTPLP